MPQRKTEEELRKAELVKVARAAIRLQHSLAADRELNDVLPDLEDAFNEKIQAGIKPGQIDLRGLVTKVLPS